MSISAATAERAGLAARTLPIVALWLVTAGCLIWAAIPVFGLDRAGRGWAARRGRRGGRPALPGVPPAPRRRGFGHLQPVPAARRRPAGAPVGYDPGPGHRFGAGAADLAVESVHPCAPWSPAQARCW